jgi:hypothetical protein
VEHNVDRCTNGHRNPKQDTEDLRHDKDLQGQREKVHHFTSRTIRPPDLSDHLLVTRIPNLRAVVNTDARMRLRL